MSRRAVETSIGGRERVQRANEPMTEVLEAWDGAMLAATTRKAVDEEPHRDMYQEWWRSVSRWSRIMSSLIHFGVG